MIKIKYFLFFLVFAFYGFSQQNPNNIELTADQLYQEGIKLYQKGEYEKAINYLEKASQKKANFGESYYYIGLCYIELLDEDKARQFLGMAKYLVEDEKLKTEINEKLKNLHTEIETRKNYKKIKEKYQNALTLYDQGEYEKAYYELEKILKEEQIQKDENFKTQIKSKMNEINEKLKEQAREQERKRREEQKRREEEKRRKEEEKRREEEERRAQLIKKYKEFWGEDFKLGLEPDGFRGIKWGTDISTLSGMKYERTDSEGIQHYIRENDELKIGWITFERIEYGFWKGKFCEVIMITKGLANYYLLKDIVFETFEGIGLGIIGSRKDESELYIGGGKKTFISLICFSNPKEISECLVSCGISSIEIFTQRKGQKKGFNFP